MALIYIFFLVPFRMRHSYHFKRIERHEGRRA